MKATPVAIASNDVLKVIDSEYLDDPGAVWSSAALFLRDPSSPISMLVRNQIGEGLKAAIKDGELAPSERNLTGEWAHESLYGGNLRPFTAECLHERMAAAALTVIAERGVRVLSDYLPRKISPIGE